MLAERLRTELARAPGEPLPVVEPRPRIEQPFGPRAVGVELRLHIGV